MDIDEANLSQDYNEISQDYNEILEFFNHDKDKALQWYLTKNPSLGGVSPYDMIKAGRGKKLMLFIRNSLDGNYP